MLDRFWEKVDKDGPLPESHPELGPCWVWTGTTHEHGYGRITDMDASGKRQPLYTHRLAFAQASGVVLTDEDDICHTCDIPACVRNDTVGTYEVDGRTYVRYGHLFAANQVANNTDRDSKGRLPLGEQRVESRLTDAQVVNIRALYLTGAISKSELARAFGVSKTTIRDILIGKLWRHIATDDISHLGRNGAATLTAEQRQTIRDAQDISNADLARQYGVNQSHISRLRSGKR